MRFIRNPSEDTPRGHTKDAIERLIVTRGYKVGDKLPTYRDLAQHFGIAVRTIERVMRQLADEGTVQLLHGKGAFVRKVPAGSGKLAEIGLVYPASRVHLMQTDYLNRILTGVISACDYDQIDVQIVALRAMGKASVPIPPRDIVLRVDGVILLGLLNETYIAEFAREAVPLALVDTQSPSPIHSISADNTRAIDQVMEHLCALGHRRIAYVDARSKDDLITPGQPEWVDSFDTHERREAYLTAVRRLGLDYQRVYLYPAEGDTPADLEAIAPALKRDRQRPTALIGYDDSIARQLCQVLPRAGLQIPGDISIAAAVTSQGGVAAGSHLLTCAIADFQDMGARAVASLRRQVAGRRGFRPAIERVGCSFLAGTTTAAPPR